MSDTPAAPRLPAPEWRLGSTARHMSFDTSADVREPGSEVPSAATLARRALIANGYVSRAARPLAFSGQEQSARPHSAPHAGQLVPQHAGTRYEALAYQSGCSDDMQQLARQPLKDSSNSVVPLSPPPSRLSPRPREPDSAERSAKRRRLPATPVGRLELLPTGSEAAKQRSAATPVSGELPPRWRAPKRRSVCQPDEASIATAVPPGAMTTSVSSPPQCLGGTPARAASRRGHIAFVMHEKQVVPETPLHQSPASSTVRAVSRADTATSGSPLRSGLRTRTCRCEFAEQQQQQPDAMETSEAEQELQANTAGTFMQPSAHVIDVQLAADLEPGALLAHSGRGHSTSEDIDGCASLRVGSCGSDPDFPVRDSVAPAARMGVMPVADTEAAPPHAQADALRQVNLPVPAGIKTCPPPSADDSCVPPTQSPAHSPCSTQDSERRQSSAGKRRRRTDSESFDPDRAVVPETLVWHAGCSQLIEADNTAALQRPAGNSLQTRSIATAAAVTAVEPPAESEGTRSCSQEPVLGFTAQLGETIRCIMSSPDGR